MNVVSRVISWAYSVKEIGQQSKQEQQFFMHLKCKCHTVLNQYLFMYIFFMLSLLSQSLRFLWCINPNPNLRLIPGLYPWGCESRIRKATVHPHAHICLPSLYVEFHPFFRLTRAKIITPKKLPEYKPPPQKDLPPFLHYRSCFYFPHFLRLLLFYFNSSRFHLAQHFLHIVHRPALRSLHTEKRGNAQQPEQSVREYADFAVVTKSLEDFDQV